MADIESREFGDPPILIRGPRALLDQIEIVPLPATARMPLAERAEWLKRQPFTPVERHACMTVMILSELMVDLGCCRGCHQKVEESIDAILIELAS